MNKKMFFLVIFLVGYMGFALAQDAADKKASPSLKFSSTACDPGLEAFDRRSRVPESIISTDWVSEKELSVVAYVRTYCSKVEMTGDYEINGNTLILKYRITWGDAFSRCMCAHKLVYDLTGIEKKDYNVTIERVR